MKMDSLIVFGVVLVAVLYLCYFLFRKKGCGCGSESGGAGCCSSNQETKDCCGEHDGKAGSGCCNDKD